jgi:hypothetical protein
MIDAMSWNILGGGTALCSLGCLAMLPGRQNQCGREVWKEARLRWLWRPPPFQEVSDGQEHTGNGNWRMVLVVVVVVVLFLMENTCICPRERTRKERKVKIRDSFKVASI